jgi:hypothetical protein
LCVKTIMIHLQAKTTCVPTTSESDCSNDINNVTNALNNDLKCI